MDEGARSVGLDPDSHGPSRSAFAEGYAKLRDGRRWRATLLTRQVLNMGADGGIVVIEGFKDSAAAERFESLIPNPINYWDTYRKDSNDPAREAESNALNVIWSYGTSQSWDIEHLERILDEDSNQGCDLKIDDLGSLVTEDEDEPHPEPGVWPSELDGFELLCRLMGGRGQRLFWEAGHEFLAQGDLDMSSHTG
jgi:hypothetical protein